MSYTQYAWWESEKFEFNIVLGVLLVCLASASNLVKDNFQFRQEKDEDIRKLLADILFLEVFELSDGASIKSTIKPS